MNKKIEKASAKVAPALVLAAGMMLGAQATQAAPITFTTSQYDNTANTVTAGAVTHNNQTTGLFRDVIWWSINNGAARTASPDYINQGSSLVACGISACPGTGPYTALNFTGPAISGGQSYLSIYDTTPGDGTATMNTFNAGVAGGITLSTDVLFAPGQHAQSGGLVALYGDGQDGLALLAKNGGGNNLDDVEFSLVFKSAGAVNVLKSTSLPAATYGVSPFAPRWYREVLNVQTSGDTWTATGTFYEHTTQADPTSALGNIISTISFSGSLSDPDTALLHLTNPGQVGLMAYGNNISGAGCPPPYTTCTDSVGVSFTNFSIPAAAQIPEPGSITLLCTALAGVGVMRRRRKAR